MRLTGAGFAVWKDDHSLPLGAPFVEEISNAVDSDKHVLLIVSAAALHSEWLKFEINLAETAPRRMIPILIEGIKADQLPLNLRMRHCLPMQKDDWRALDKLVDHLEGQGIARLVNLSGHTDLQVSNGLLLGSAAFRQANLASPEAVTAYGVELARFVLPYLREARAGIVPPGHAPAACVMLAYLLGEWNNLPRIFVTHRNEQGVFQVDGTKPLALQAVRDQAFADRSQRDAQRG